MNIFDRILWGNPLKDWLLALIIALGAFLVLNALKRILSRRIRAWVKKTETDLDDLVVDLINRTWYLFLAMASIYAGSLILAIPKLESGLRTVLIILFWVQAALWGTGVVDYLVSRHVKQQRQEKDAETETAMNALRFIGKVALWTVAVLLALDNIPSIQVDTLITSLGISGIAVALAVQNILGDLFASLSIILDKPFIIDDFIAVGDFSGTVEHIGLKSTRVRSLTGEQLVFSNSDLLNSRIRNYKRMDKRRVSFTLGVLGETSHEKLGQIPGILQQIIESQPQARFDRAHFREFGDFALNFEVVYYMLTSDFRVFVDTQHAINMEILKRFAEQGIEFAYPTQTILLAR